MHEFFPITNCVLFKIYKVQQHFDVAIRVSVKVNFVYNRCFLYLENLEAKCQLVDEVAGKYERIN